MEEGGEAGEADGGGTGDALAEWLRLTQAASVLLDRKVRRSDGFFEEVSGREREK
jgi:hypothetical protein